MLFCLVVLIIAIHFCMISRTLTSRNLDVSRIDWPTVWESHRHLLAVFHCFVPFIGYQYNLESVCWPTKRFMKNSLFIFTPCLLYHLLYHFSLIHWDQTKEIVCRSNGSRPTQVQELFTLASLWNTFLVFFFVQLFQLLPLRNKSRHISLTWPFPYTHQHSRQPIDVAKLLHRFCCWTPIRLLYHWA